MLVNERYFFERKGTKVSKTGHQVANSPAGDKMGSENEVHIMLEELWDGGGDCPKIRNFCRRIKEKNRKGSGVSLNLHPAGIFWVYPQRNIRERLKVTKRNLKPPAKKILKTFYWSFKL